MLTFGFSGLPCACAANGSNTARVAHAATTRLRKSFIVSSSNKGSADSSRRLPPALSFERRCSHSVTRLSTRHCRLELRRRRMKIARFSGLDDLPGQFVADDLAEPARCGEQPIEVDTCVVAHALQHVHDVLGADIAGCAGREWATSQAPQATFEAHDARCEPGENIREPHTARVVKMQRQREIRKALCDGANELHFHNTRGMGLANVLAGLAAGVRSE